MCRPGRRRWRRKRRGWRRKRQDWRPQRRRCPFLGRNWRKKCQRCRLKCRRWRKKRRGCGWWRAATPLFGASLAKKAAAVPHLAGTVAKKAARVAPEVVMPALATAALRHACSEATAWPLPLRRQGEAGRGWPQVALIRSEEHTSELPSLMRISYAVFCLTKNNTT